MRKVIAIRETRIGQFSRARLDKIVTSVIAKMQSDELRALHHRVLRKKLEEQIPEIQLYLANFRQSEQENRSRIFECIHSLLSTFNGKKDASERLYLILRQYGWAKDFCEKYTHNIPDDIPEKKLSARVKVVGMGIAGSLAVSGLAKHGIEVVGYEKRKYGESKGILDGGVGMRYQNASWTGYDVSEKLLDAGAFLEMKRCRQKLNKGDGSVEATDRVQIIIGDAIRVALESAKKYSAKIHFDETHTLKEYLSSNPDIVALFCGANTARIFDLEEKMGVEVWKKLFSDCIMWLQIRPTKKDVFLFLGGEIGAEKFNFFVKSVREGTTDLDRIRLNLEKSIASNSENKPKLEQQLSKLCEITTQVRKGSRFEYIFSTAPNNQHNRDKRKRVGGDLLLEGKYSVEVKMAANSVVSSPGARTIVVTGGDATVPPNPLSAYGATLACYFAEMLVNLSVSVGHLNMMAETNEGDIAKLKRQLVERYDSHGRAENYIQFIQTLISNLYSLPKDLAKN